MFVPKGSFFIRLFILVKVFQMKVILLMLWGRRETKKFQLITFIYGLKSWKCKHSLLLSFQKSCVILTKLSKRVLIQKFTFLNPIECVFVCGCFIFLFSLKSKTEEKVEDVLMCLVCVHLCLIHEPKLIVFFSFISPQKLFSLHLASLSGFDSMKFFFYADFFHNKKVSCGIWKLQ